MTPGIMEHTLMVIKMLRQIKCVADPCQETHGEFLPKEVMC